MENLNIEASTEATSATTIVATPKVPRASIKVERADMTAAIAGEWLEVRTDVFTPEEHGVDQIVEQKNLYWKKSVLGRPVGSFAGQRRPVDDYYSVTLCGNSYSGNRLIHLLEHGEWPADEARSTGAPRTARAPLAVRTAPVPLTAAQRAAAREQLKQAAAAKKVASGKPATATEVATGEQPAAYTEALANNGIASM